MAYIAYAERRAMAASSRSSVYSTSMNSISNQIGARVRNMTNIGRPHLEIDLETAHGAHGRYVTSYSTMDIISGTVSVTASTDTRFEDIEIAFVGEAKTHVDRVTSSPPLSGRTDATHRFLTLKQPIDEAGLPQPRILQGGKTYKFNFNFTVPAQLLPRSCSHKAASDHVRQMHLMLPPSFGDPSVSGHSGVLLDDFAPDMSRIEYSIRARLSQARETDGATTLLADKQRKVRIKPAIEEQPPLNTEPFDREYRISQEKSVRKGMFKGKLGTLIMQSSQPKPFVIPGARTAPGSTVSTMAKVLLRFDPADSNSKPPKLGSLASKLKVSTYFASSPRTNFPSRAALGFDMTQGVYQESISLSTLCVASAQWTHHTADENPPPDLSRRDSGISDCSTTSNSPTPTPSIPPQSKTYNSTPFYTATILVPLALPNTKTFIPTFHSCLISRIYTLSLNLSVQAAGVTDPSFSLKLPVQICAEGSATGAENARVRAEENLAAREAEDLFVPRVVRAEVGADLPPEYAVFAPGVGVAVAG